MTLATVGVVILTARGVEMPDEIRQAYYRALALEEEFHAAERTVLDWIKETTDAQR